MTFFSSFFFCSAGQFSETVTYAYGDVSTFNSHV